MHLWKYRYVAENTYSKYRYMYVYNLEISIFTFEMIMVNIQYISADGRMDFINIIHILHRLEESVHRDRPCVASNHFAIKKHT